jgi:Type VI secretion system VasI, EvfG, VC_A0118
MISARLTVIALLAAAGVGSARAADGGGKGLELCIETARGADAACAKLTDDPTQRLQCFNKARDAQLDCLEHALAEPPTGTTTSQERSGTSQPEPSASTALGDAPLQAAPKESSQRNSQESSLGNTQGSREPNSSSSEPPSGSIPSKEPASTAQATPAAVPSPAPSPEAPSATTSPKEPASAAQTTPEAAPSPAPSPTPAAASGAVQGETPKVSARQPRPPESRWVVSETTSPVDYSPLLTAVIRPSSSSPGGPVSLAVRCRAGQTALLIRTEGTWHATRRNALPVDFQIDDQSTARQTWTLQADGKIATYADDPIELLKSLPDGARLSVGVPDGADAHQQSTFLLIGWNAIRSRVEAACRWPKMTEHASSGKR